jgi:hypothetical protein
LEERIDSEAYSDEAQRLSPMMEKVEQIPVSLDLEEVGSRLRAADLEQVEGLLDVARPLISGRAVYKVCYVEEKLEDAVIVDGIRLTSRILRRNLDKVGRVFAYVVTIGAELEEKADACTDILQKYYLDTIANMALIKARKHLEEHLRSRFALNGLSFMSPGSLADWPLEEQRPLFSLFKGAEESIDVSLTENLLMLPRKTVSGIFFPTEVTFYNCQLCPREKCEGRKASYNENLAKEYGILK